MDARMRWGVCEGAHLPGIKLCEDAAEGPNVDAHVVREAEDHLRDAFPETVHRLGLLLSR